MTYAGLLTALQATLSTVTGLTVSIGEKKALGTFPYACISNLNHDNEFKDLAGNKRQYQFVIRFYYRTDNTNDPDFEIKLATVVDSVISILEHEVTLGGVCDFATPSKGNWTYGEKEVPVRICEIKITANGRILR